jgi:hypothetical protein
MPHNISGNPVLLDSPSAIDRARSPIELKPEPVQVDCFADRLMDELFEDVEKLLEGSVPPEPVKPVRKAEPPKHLSFDIAPTPRSADIVARPNLPQWKSSENLSKKPKTRVKRKQTKPRGTAFQKVLVFAFCASALTAVSVWVANRGIFPRLTAVASPSSPTVATIPAPKVVPADTNPQFAQYMMRSLATIDRRVATGKPTVGVLTVPYTNPLPTVPVSKTVAKSGSTLPETPVVINVPAAPAAAPATNSPAGSSELNQILSRLSSVLEKLSPALNRPAAQSAPIARANTASTEPQRTLRGIAIATDPSQSAVLFEMNGITQRHFIGESIGSSGWSVVDISNNYVTVRRNGEVRSISVGQKL